MTEDEFSATIQGVTLKVPRRPQDEEASEPDELPENVEADFPGP